LFTGSLFELFLFVIIPETGPLLRNVREKSGDLLIEEKASLNDLPEISAKTNSSGSLSPAVALWEIVSVVLSFGIGEWVVLAFVPKNKLMLAVPALAALSLVLFSKKERGESWRDIGWRLDNFGSAIRIIVLPTLIGAAIILFAGWQMSSFHFSRNNLVTWGLGLLVWAFAQQFFLQGFINRRSQIIWGKGWISVLVVAVIFAGLHLPNPILSLASFIGAIIWATTYQRYPNLFAVAFSHAFLSFLIVMSLPNWLLNNMRVGFKYLA